MQLGIMRTGFLDDDPLPFVMQKYLFITLKMDLQIR